MIKIHLSDDIVFKILTEHESYVKKFAIKKIKDTLQGLDAVKHEHFLSIFKENNELSDNKIIEILMFKSKKEFLDFNYKLEKAFEDDDKENNTSKTIVYKCIRPLFNKLYGAFSRTEWAICFLKTISCDVCPYCNRIYTFTVNKNGKSKPEFDHYYPKSEYPLFALSIFNLVPCCSYCNKGKGNTTENILYPYETCFEDEKIHFTIDSKNIDYLYNTDEEFMVKLQCENENSEKTVETHDKLFKLSSLYSLHKDYVAEILIKKQVYNESQINELLHAYPKFFSSKEEVLRLLYGTYIGSKDFAKRPLSKMTSDILKELNII